MSMVIDRKQQLKRILSTPLPVSNPVTPRTPKKSKTPVRLPRLPTSPEILAQMHQPWYQTARGPVSNRNNASKTDKSLQHSYSVPVLGSRANRGKLSKIKNLASTLHYNWFSSLKVLKSACNIFGDIDLGDNNNEKKSARQNDTGPTSVALYPDPLLVDINLRNRCSYENVINLSIPSDINNDPSPNNDIKRGDSSTSSSSTSSSSKAISTKFGETIIFGQGGPISSALLIGERPIHVKSIQLHKTPSGSWEIRISIFDPVAAAAAAAPRTQRQSTRKSRSSNNNKNFLLFDGSATSAPEQDFRHYKQLEATVYQMSDLSNTVDAVLDEFSSNTVTIRTVLKLASVSIDREFGLWREIKLALFREVELHHNDDDNGNNDDNGLESKLVLDAFPNNYNDNQNNNLETSSSSSSSSSSSNTISSYKYTESDDENLLDMIDSEEEEEEEGDMGDQPSSAMNVVVRAHLLANRSVEYKAIKSLGRPGTLILEAFPTLSSSPSASPSASNGESSSDNEVSESEIESSQSDQDSVK